MNIETSEPGRFLQSSLTFVGLLHNLKTLTIVGKQMGLSEVVVQACMGNEVEADIVFNLGAERSVSLQTPEWVKSEISRLGNSEYGYRLQDPGKIYTYHVTLYLNALVFFGSWYHALQGCDLPKGVKGSKLSDEFWWTTDVKAIAQGARDSGVSLEDIQKYSGVVLSAA